MHNQHKIYKNLSAILIVKKAIWLIPILLAVILLIFLINLPEWPTPENSDSESEAGIAENSQDPLNEFPDEDIPPQDDPITTGSADSSGGGGSGGSSSDDPSSCSQIPISYALKNFMKDSTCLSYNDNTCIDKIINCSVQVQNLDMEVSGEFTVKIRLQELENQNIIEETEVTYPVEQESLKIFEKAFSFQNEEANKNYTCIFSTTQTPTKSSC